MMTRGLLGSVLLGTILIAIATLGRLAPHPPNFAPVAAAAMFAGFYFRRPLPALAVPLAAMGLSDLIIGGYDWRIMAAVYAGLAWPVALQPLLQTLLVRRVAICSFTCSAVFFLVSNAAVWAFSPMYEPTVVGLAACYLAALPFFAYTLAGDLFWCAVFFGGYALSTSSAARRIRWELSAATFGD